MMEMLRARMVCWAMLAAFPAFNALASGTDEPVTRDQSFQLQQENDLLRRQLLKQRQLIGDVKADFSLGVNNLPKY